MKNIRFVVSLVAVLVARLSAHATTVDISGTFNYGFGSGAASTFAIQFVYDPAHLLSLVPAGTIVDGLPLSQDFYSVPATGISDLSLRIGGSGWVAATTTGFWIDGNIGVVGASVHDLLGSFNSSAGFISFGSTSPGGGKTHIIDDVFITGGGFSPGSYSISVTPSRGTPAPAVPENAPTGGLTAMALLVLGVVEIRRRKTAAHAAA